MEKKIYAYVRVSSRDQNANRQIAAMLKNGIPKEMIIVEKQSGKDFERPLYQKLIRQMKSGDTLVIKSIDRLGRNYTEILEEWRKITKKKHCDIVALDIPLLDTRTKEGTLTGKFIADLVLQILSYIAQNERENIRQRQAEGIEAAKERGVKFGRPRASIPPEFANVREKYKKGELSSRMAAKHLGVSQNTFLQWLADAST